MPIIGYMSKIPIFSTPREAMNWGATYGLKSYHTHMVNIRTGYMGGVNHKECVTGYRRFIYNQQQTANNNQTTTPTPQPPPTQQPTPPPTQPTPQNTPTPSPQPTNTPMGGGGGGGY